MTKIPLIIDTDLTADDVVAIAMAANCEKFDIRAITCYGEWFMETVQLRNSLGLDCPVCWGAMKPLFRQESDVDIYGTLQPDFDGNTRINPKDEEYPWDKIYAESVKAEGSLEILTLGPVTNIAQTILRYPQIKPLINHIFCFAGSGYSGNVAPYSEYNAWADPDALKILFDSGIAVTMCGLDSVEPCALGREELAEIYPINDTVKTVVDMYRKSADDEILLPAAAAASCYINYDVISVKEFYVAVETKGTLALGQTVVDRLGKYKKVPNIKVVVSSSKNQFLNNLKRITEQI
ncbi:MAG: nucleoside hydrolase [Oscillospiraceae bacterium]|nr:nucleoside hydrolase [Oscillospiraceae bacterium]